MGKPDPGWLPMGKPDSDRLSMAKTGPGWLPMGKTGPSIGNGVGEEYPWAPNDWTINDHHLLH